jgi:hypothetical protein
MPFRKNDSNNPSKKRKRANAAAHEKHKLQQRKNYARKRARERKRADELEEEDAQQNATLLMNFSKS